MMRTTMIALGALLLAAPAYAAPQSAKGAAASTVAPERKYCIQYDDVVGTRLQRMECRTKAEWARQRVDVDKLMND